MGPVRSDPAVPVPSPQPADSPPPVAPDVWLATITAAMQTYAELGRTTGPVTAATISSVLGQAQTRQVISPPVAASISEFVQTSQGAAVVAGSAILATRAFAYIRAHASPATAAPKSLPPLSAADGALRSATTGSATPPEAASQPSSPLPQLTTIEAVAVVESTNRVLRSLGQPALPGQGWRREIGSNGGGTSTGDGGEGVLSGAVFGGGTSTGDGGEGVLSQPPGQTPGRDGIPDEPGLEEDWLGNALVGIGVGSLGEGLLEAIGKEIASEVLINAVETASDDAIGDYLTLPDPDPDVGTGSGAGGAPGSIEGGPFGDGETGDGSGGDEGGSGGGGGNVGVDGSKDPEQPS
jgi:hypothetical protein